MRTVTADEAVRLVQSGNRVYVHEASMAPRSLIDALVRRADSLADVEVAHLHTEVEAPYVEPRFQGHLRHNALFTGSNVRDAVNDGRADFTPVFLSEIPALIRDGTLGVDVAFLQVSPPDRHGFCRLGLSVATARAAADHAKMVVAEINPRVPRTMGNSALHVSRIDAAVEVDRPLPQGAPAPFGEVERAIGKHVAALIPHGATIQLGIGAVPNAVLDQLREHRDLGVHTEMFSDGLVDLSERGVVTNRCKSRFEGRVVTSFASGTSKLHRFVDGNPFVEFHPTSVVNDPMEIAKQHTMIAVNSALEVDLTGQVCADSVGERVHSGIGGQMDFVQGAVRSPGGKAIIALPSTAKNGSTSRLVPRLKPGAGVVTTRGHVQWIVTEHGAVNLRGRSLRQRADMLISVAHPDFRAELRAAAAGRKLFLRP
ncbi:MAG: acetyl-CoA hydrolase/transferase family protein [Myxococcota bacterium]